MSTNTVVFLQNPKIDYLFGYFGGGPVLTKQDKFKAIDVVQIHENGTEEILKDFYIKKPDSDSIKKFNESIQALAREQFSENNIIKKPIEVEIVLSISVTKKRFKEVDVDNLAKAILDSLNEIVYEDDSQITSLICSKYISEENGILIGVTILNSTSRGFINDIKLFYEK